MPKMDSNRILNPVFFLRGCEPRAKDDAFLLETAQQQMLLVKAVELPATWLLQYDAMLRPELVAFIKRELGPEQDIGLWLEIVQPLVEKAGLKWRGRHPWDWHPQVGFLIGYTPAEREQIIDVAMSDFKALWGRHPSSVGAWFIDAHALAYLHDKYGIVASCNCREQFGTDGYGLWGGYWSGAYYPSRKNSLIPGQTADGQIPVPVFRMLGADPIYQYASEIRPQHFYEGYGHQGRTQDIITLEPCRYHPDCGGGNADWVDWFLETNFSSPCLAVAYAQAGQENSMGWDGMKDALPRQFKRFKELQRQGRLTVETLAASGRRFRHAFKTSPPTAVCALADWRREGRAAIWYMSRFQRLGFLVDDGDLFIRDWQLYDENYPEPFLDTVCRETSCLYDALPVMDGFRWKEPGGAMSEFGKPFQPVQLPASAGFRLSAGKGKITRVEEPDGAALRITWTSQGGETVIDCTEQKVSFAFPGCGHFLEMRCWNAEAEGTSITLTPPSVSYIHSGHSYELQAVTGMIDAPSGRLLADGRALELRPHYKRHNQV